MSLRICIRDGKEPELSKNEPNPEPQEPNRTEPRKESYRTQTQMSWILLGSFTEWNRRYISLISQ